MKIDPIRLVEPTVTVQRIASGPNHWRADVTDGPPVFHHRLPDFGDFYGNVLDAKLCMTRWGAERWARRRAKQYATEPGYQLTHRKAEA